VSNQLQTRQRATIFAFPPRFQPTAAQVTSFAVLMPFIFFWRTFGTIVRDQCASASNLAIGVFSSQTVNESPIGVVVLVRISLWRSTTLAMPTRPQRTQITHRRRCIGTLRPLLRQQLARAPAKDQRSAYSVGALHQIMNLSCTHESALVKHLGCCSMRALRAHRGAVSDARCRQQAGRLISRASGHVWVSALSIDATLRPAGGASQRDEFLAALESARTIELDSYGPRFAPQAQTGCQCVELAIADCAGKLIR
jgi:hypothetical protein